MKKLVLHIFIIFFYVQSFSQNSIAVPEKMLLAGAASDEISIDGILNETSWQHASSASDFIRNFPDDTSFALNKTSVKIIVSRDYLFIGAELNIAVLGRSYIVSTLKRDFPEWENDYFGILIDAFNDNTNGYGFLVSAANVQSDEQIFNGSEIDLSWDAKWFSAIKQYPEKRVFEIAIPLKYLRFKENVTSWNINFIRNEVESNERSSWVSIPRNFTLANLAFMGKLVWQTLPKKSKKNYFLIPSITMNLLQNNYIQAETKVKPSLDAKIALSSSLNLDVTINPDFSQAETDIIQINLTRFELVFPERRKFFLENSDLFSQFGGDAYGSSPARSFYSRRIGLRYDSISDQYMQTRVLGGIRISGKINKNLRIGVMTIQTAVEKNILFPGGILKNYPGQNYTVIALQQKIFYRSSVGILLESRQGFGTETSSEFKANRNDYDRLIGLDYTLASKNNQWTGKFFNHFLLTGKNKENIHIDNGGVLNYYTRKIRSWLGWTYINPFFAPQMGYTPRTDLINLHGQIGRVFYPSSKIVNSFELLFFSKFFFDSHFNKTDYSIVPTLHFTEKNTSEIWLTYTDEYVMIKAPFDPSKSGGKALDSGANFRFSHYKAHYISDQRKTIFGNLLIDAGRYFNGTATIIKADINRKFQPWAIVGINFNLNFIRLPLPYASNNIIYIGSRFDISFSKSLSWLNLIQYDSQLNTFSIYTKLQWRFRPLSDIFIIYTRNQETVTWKRENQSLFIKIVYWLSK